jgi:exosortase K
MINKLLNHLKLTESDAVVLAMVLVGAVLLKHHYSTAAVNDLVWILRPTAWTVDAFSIHSFEWEPNSGYMSRTAMTSIVKSCAGINFFIISLSMGSFTIIPNILRLGCKLMALLAIAAATFCLTVFVNGVRIAIGMHLGQAGLYSVWLTPERMHRLEGIVTYYLFLWVVYVILRRAVAGRKIRRLSELKTRAVQ